MTSNGSTLLAYLKLFNGKSIKTVSTGLIPVYGSNGKIGFAEKPLYSNAIILGRVGAYCGSVQIDRNEFWASDNTIVVKNNEKSDLEFLYYYLVNLKLNQFAGGAAQPLITHTLLNSIKADLPDLPTQRQISGVILTYDNLIENNEKRIKILEEMAQRLYEEWFVKFKFPGHEKVNMVDSPLGKIPEGWKGVLMKDVANVVDCLHSKKPNRVVEGNRLFLQLNNILDNGLIDLSEKYLISQEDYNKWTKNIELQEGDCVVTNVGRIAATAQIPKKITAALGRNMTGIRPIKIPASFLIQYLKSSHMHKEVKRKTDAGAIMGSLNVKNIYLLNVILPTNNILQNFNLIISSMRAEMESLHENNSLLIKMRDLIIPQFVTGRRELNA